MLNIVIFSVYFILTTITWFLILCLQWSRYTVSKPYYSLKHPLGVLKESEVYTVDGEINPILYIGYNITKNKGYEVLTVGNDEELHAIIKSGTPPILVYGRIDNIIETENIDLVITHYYDKREIRAHDMKVCIYVNKRNNYSSLPLTERLKEILAIRKIAWFSRDIHITMIIIKSMLFKKERYTVYSVLDLENVGEKINKNYIKI